MGHLKHPPKPKRTYAEKLGLKLRARRVELDMHQKDVAERAGISIPIVQGIESGTANFTIQSLEKLCWALDIELHINFIIK